MKFLLVFLGVLLFSAVLFSTLPKWMRAKGDGYNFRSLKEKELQAQAELAKINTGEFFASGLKVFDLDGEKIKIESLWQDKPLVLEFGSKSSFLCNLNNQSMDSLFLEFKDRVSFALLYVREANPGLVSPPHRSFEQKLYNANILQAKKRVMRPLYVDSLKGAVHKAGGLGANSVYLIGTDGLVYYFSYTNEPLALRKAIESLLESNNQEQSSVVDENHCFHKKDQPGFYYRVNEALNIFYSGGPDAFFDFLLSSPGTDGC